MDGLHSQVSILGAAALGVGCCLLARARTRPEWTEGPRGTWAARVDAAVTPFKGGVLLVGGFSSRRHSDTWWTDGREWKCCSRDADAPFPRRMQHGLCCTGDGVLMTGGQTAGWRLLNDVWCLRDGQWQQLSEAAPWKPRNDFAVASLSDSSLLVSGGASGQRVLDDVYWLCDISDKDQSAKTPAPWGARRSHHMVALPGGRVLVFGGVDESGRFQRDMWLGENKSWSRLEDVPWQPRSHSACCTVGSDVLLSGGVSEHGMLADIWCLETSAGYRWRCETSQAPFGPRAKHVMAFAEGTRTLLVAAGVSPQGHFLADTWKSRR